MNKVRESNFEVMRIISMFFIIIYHMLIVTGGKLLIYTTGFTHMALQLLSLLIVVHVNSFVLISGYFQYNKKTSFKKVTNLISMALFYSIIIALIFDITGLSDIDFLGFVKVFSPLEFQNLWFLVMYMALYLLAPYLNILIEKLNQIEHRKFLILSFVMFSVISTITNQSTFSNGGFTLIHFMFLYFLGAYLKKYPISENIHFKNYSKKKKLIVFSSLFVFFGVINYLLLFFCDSLLKMEPNNFIAYICGVIKSSRYYYSAPLVVAQSVCYFLIFENFSFKSKIVNCISGSVFAVYIITENPYILPKLYEWTGINTGKMQMVSSLHIFAKIIMWTVIIFTVCVTIEIIRKKVVSLLKNFINKKRNLSTKVLKKNN